MASARAFLVLLVVLIGIHFSYGFGRCGPNVSCKFFQICCGKDFLECCDYLDVSGPGKDGDQTVTSGNARHDEKWVENIFIFVVIPVFVLVLVIPLCCWCCHGCPENPRTYNSLQNNTSTTVSLPPSQVTQRSPYSPQVVPYSPQVVPYSPPVVPYSPPVVPYSPPVLQPYRQQSPQPANNPYNIPMPHPAHNPTAEIQQPLPSTNPSFYMSG